MTHRNWPDLNTSTVLNILLLAIFPSSTPLFNVAIISFSGEKRDNHRVSMACKTFCLANYLTHSFPFLSKLPPTSSINQIHFANYSTSNFSNRLNSTALSTNSFTWDDVIQIGQSEPDPSDLTGFFDKVTACNRNLVCNFCCNIFCVFWFGGAMNW